MPAPAWLIFRNHPKPQDLSTSAQPSPRHHHPQPDPFSGPVDISASFDRVFGFLTNPLNWPHYAIVNLRSVAPDEKGWFKMVTKFGEGEVQVRPVRDLGIIDHEWRDPQASWIVPARIVTNGDGVTVMYTLFQPPVMTDAQFDAAMQDMDVELNQLRKLMEGQANFDSLPVPATASANVRIIQDLYAAFGRRDMTRIFQLLSPDVEISQSTDLPWGGEYRGHAGARQFFSKLGAQLDSTLSLERLVDSGDCVTAVGWTQGTVKTTRVHYRVAIVHQWKIAAGVIVAVHFLIDHPVMQSALQAEAVQVTEGVSLT